MNIMNGNAHGSNDLVIDGLNGAEITRQQMERTLAGGVNAIQHTFLRPQTHTFEAAMVELMQKLRCIEEMPDLASIACSVADIEKAWDNGRVAVIIGAHRGEVVGAECCDRDRAGVIGVVLLRLPRPQHAHSRRTNWWDVDNRFAGRDELLGEQVAESVGGLDRPRSLLEPVGPLA